MIKPKRRRVRIKPAPVCERHHVPMLVATVRDDFRYYKCPVRSCRTTAKTAGPIWRFIES